MKPARSIWHESHGVVWFARQDWSQAAEPPESEATASASSSCAVKVLQSATTHGVRRQQPKFASPKRIPRQAPKRRLGYEDDEVPPERLPPLQPKPAEEAPDDQPRQAVVN